MPKHKTGRKITTSHTTIIDAAIPVVDVATNLSEVNKISLGIIKQVGKSRSGQHRIKFLAVTGGWKVTVRGSTTVQEIYIYTAQPLKTKKAIEEGLS